jgi:hypothetical protein
VAADPVVGVVDEVGGTGVVAGWAAVLFVGMGGLETDTVLVEPPQPVSSAARTAAKAGIAVRTLRPGVIGSHRIRPDRRSSPVG